MTRRPAASGRTAPALVLVLLVGVLLVPVVPAGPANAAGPWRIAKGATSGHDVVIKGRSPNRSGTVRLERRKNGRWVVIKRVKATRHAYRGRVWAPTGTSRWRAAHAKRSSKSLVVVVEKRARPKSTPSPAKPPAVPAQPAQPAPRTPVPVPTPVPEPTTTPPPPSPSPEDSGGGSNLLEDLVGPVLDEVRDPGLEGVVGAPGPEPTAPSATPTVTPTATPTGEGLPADDCGPRVRKRDGTLWECTFHDDFDGTRPDGTGLDRTRWTPLQKRPVGGNGIWSCYVDRPENIAVAGGSLRLTVRDDAAPEACSMTEPGKYYTNATVTTWHGFSQKYGRFEARMKSQYTSAPGLHEAFWLWPDDRYLLEGLLGLKWPQTGEIDISETYSSYPTLSVPFLHYTKDDNGGARVGVNTSHSCYAARGAWNTYVLEWAPKQLDVYVNGRLCLSNTSGDIAFQQHYILMLSQVIGHTTNPVTPETPFPATLEVDHVRVWK